MLTTAAPLRALLLIVDLPVGDVDDQLMDECRGGKPTSRSMYPIIYFLQQSGIDSWSQEDFAFAQTKVCKY